MQYEVLIQDTQAIIAEALSFLGEGVEPSFRDRPGDLLEFNLSQSEALEKLCGFLGRSSQGITMPHRNRSSWPPPLPIHTSAPWMVGAL